MLFVVMYYCKLSCVCTFFGKKSQHSKTKKVEIIKLRIYMIFIFIPEREIECWVT